MQISVVIIVRNEEKRIRQCLESLLQQKGISENEIIVVDGLSSDRTRGIVKEFCKSYKFIKLVECSQYGYSYQRNVGAENSSGKYILYISGDTRLGSNFIERYLQTIEDGYDVVQGTIINIADQSYFNKIMTRICSLFYFKNINTDCEEFSTVNVLIRKNLIIERNFDHSLNSLEDKEWFSHFYHRVKFKRLKGAVVYHLVHETFFQYMKKIHREAMALGKISARSKSRKIMEELNFFKWLRYTITINLVFLVCLMLIILNCVLELNIFFYLVPILALVLCPINYTRSIVKEFKPVFAKLFSSIVVFLFIISVITGVTKGYITNIFSSWDTK